MPKNETEEKKEKADKEPEDQRPEYKEPLQEPVEGANDAAESDGLYYYSVNE